MRTNKLTRAFIQRRDISLESHQTELAKRYSENLNNRNKMTNLLNNRLKTETF